MGIRVRVDYEKKDPKGLVWLVLGVMLVILLLIFARLLGFGVLVRLG